MVIPINEEKEDKKMAEARENRLMLSNKLFSCFSRMKCTHETPYYDRTTFFNKCILSQSLSKGIGNNLPDLSDKLTDPRKNFGESSYSMTRTLNIISWNCESYENKLDALQSLMQMTGPDAVCLQETYLNCSKAEELKNEIRDFTLRARTGT